MLQLKIVISEIDNDEAYIRRITVLISVNLHIARILYLSYFIYLIGKFFNILFPRG